MDKELIKETAKEFLVRHYPDYVPEFALMWKVVSRRIADTKKRGASLQLGLSFGDEADPQTKKVMRVFGIFSLVYHQSPKEKEEILEYIKKNCEHMEINTDLEQKIRDTVEFMYTSVPIKSRDHAKLWTNGCDGRVLNKEEFEEYEGKKQSADYDIFIIDKGEFKRGSVGEVYFDGQPVFRNAGSEEKRYLTPLEYRILVYTLKQKGMPGELYNIVTNCWLDTTAIPQFKENWDKFTKGIISKDDFNDATSGYRKSISKVSTFLDEYFGIDLQTRGTGKYSLSSSVEYCVVESVSD